MAEETTKSITGLMLAGSWVTERLNVFFKPFDLTVQQYNVLRILRGKKGVPVNLFELQKDMIHKMSNTTRLIEKLRLKGFVDRNICESNRRKVEITITDKGLGLLDVIDENIQAFEKKIMRNFTKADHEQLAELLSKINIR